MTRTLSAAVLVAVLAPAAGAQPVPAAPPPEAVVPVPPPPAVFWPNVYVPPGTRPGPAIPFHKSGGVVVGAYGFYPYDTGEWLLAGTQGLTRQSGSFTMVYPDAPPAAGSCRHPLFRGHK